MLFFILKFCPEYKSCTKSIRCINLKLQWYYVSMRNALIKPIRSYLHFGVLKFCPEHNINTIFEQAVIYGTSINILNVLLHIRDPIPRSHLI